jgi:hypothetical protein
MQLKTTGQIEIRDSAMKELLPKLHMRFFDANQLIQESFQRTTGKDAKFAVQGEIEDFIEDQRSGGIVGHGQWHASGL